MAIKIFLLGRPGSGKSTAARYIDETANKFGWSTVHINDYKFLFEMFEADTRHKRFQPSGCGGFDVIDFSVLNQALQAVEDEANLHITSTNKLLLLEFARNDYSSAIRQFHPSFLHDAYFLFFEANLETCIHRVFVRTVNPTFSDDHFISEEMIRSYYGVENKHTLTYSLLTNYDISEKHIFCIQNMGSQHQFHKQLRRFLENILVENIPYAKNEHTEEERCYQLSHQRSNSQAATSTF